MFLSLSLPLSPKSINIILGENLKNKNKKKEFTTVISLPYLGNLQVNQPQLLRALAAKQLGGHAFFPLPQGYPQPMTGPWPQH